MVSGGAVLANISRFVLHCHVKSNYGLSVALSDFDFIYMITETNVCGKNVKKMDLSVLGSRTI